MARDSALAARERPDVKGSGRRYTVHRTPSILELIQCATSMVHLHGIRVTIGLSYNMGKMDADKKTLRQWDDAFYSRVVFLLLCSPTIERLCLDYETQRSWDKAPELVAVIEQAFQARAKQLPNPTERLLAAGITIEGITRLPSPPISA